MTQQFPSPDWLEQLDQLLATLHDERTAASEDQLANQLTTLDPALLGFLVEQVAAQQTPEAAGFLEIVAGQPALGEEVRARAREALQALVTQGVSVAPPGVERFLAGYVQQARERGEQIMLLGWRLPDATIEALVYLLDWRGDGLKDFYVTRRLSDDEWRQLVEHNAGKGAPLVEITLAEARALLEAALAESKRYSRPLPREYRLSHSLSERRVLQVEVPPLPAPPRSYVSDALTPEEVVSAYVAALHYRDFALVAELLAPEHPLRAGRPLEETIGALRAEAKQGPRRAEEVSLSAPAETESGDTKGDTRRTLDATGAEVRVEKSGKRVRTVVRERYTLARTDGRWRIRDVERLTP